MSHHSDIAVELEQPVPDGGMARCYPACEIQLHAAREAEMFAIAFEAFAPQAQASHPSPKSHAANTRPAV